MITQRVTLRRQIVKLEALKKEIEKRIEIKKSTLLNLD